MRSIPQIIKAAVVENVGTAIACTRAELLHGLSAVQPPTEAWAKLKGDVENCGDDLVVIIREELLAALVKGFTPPNNMPAPDSEPQICLFPAAGNDETETDAEGDENEENETGDE